MKSISTFLLSIIIIGVLTSCTSSRINPKRINQAAIPEGFKCSECVLLVLKRTTGVNHKGITNYIRRSFEKHYTGKFEMVSQLDLDTNSKYRDKNVYRFVVSDRVMTGGSKKITTTTTNTITTTSNNTAVNNSVSGGTEIQYNYTYTMDFRIYDRLNDKNYPSLGVSSNVPAKAINRTSVLLNTLYKS